MILLAGTSDLVTMVTGGASGPITVYAAYQDILSGIVTFIRLNSLVSSATTTTIVGSPAASTVRNVSTLVIHNSNTSSSNMITVQHTDGTHVAILFGPYTLLPGETIEYYNELGFMVINAVGMHKGI